MKTHRFEVWQNGVMVASGEAPHYHDALREIARYAAQYEQDGPIEIKVGGSDDRRGKAG